MPPILWTDRRRAASAALALLALAAFMPSASGSSPALRPGPVSHAPLDRLLAAHVRGEGVDYAALRTRDLGRLVAYLDTLAAVDPASLPAKERLAFELNLYNATVLRAVCERLRPGWSPAESSFAVFGAPLVRRAGHAISLNALENDIIRSAFRDPRVHVALVCAARSCPPLPPRAYRAGDLDSVLDANMRRFLADTTRNRVDARAKRLELSRLFDWYAADFGGAGAVAAYVAKWTGRPVAGWPVTFRDYDWSLNAAARPAPDVPGIGKKPMGGTGP